MSAEQLVELEIEDHLATLRLNRPQSSNALTLELVEQFDAHLTTLEASPGVRAMIVCGAGRGFCAGADLAEMASLSAAEAATLQLRTAQVYDRLAALPIPSLAAAQGFAVGGGFFLLLYCDLRVVALGTKLGFPAAARQWIPPWALSRLASWVGIRRAEQLLLTQSLFTPEVAQTWGLVDQVVPPEDLWPLARRRARELAETPREVVAEIRQYFAALRGFEHRTWDELSAAGFQRRISAPAAKSAMEEFFRGRERPRGDGA